MEIFFDCIGIIRYAPIDIRGSSILCVFLASNLRMTEGGFSVSKSLCLIVVALLVVIAFPPLSFADDVSVKGYWRDSNHDGVKDTYVSPSHRTSPNSTVKDNYGYPGNYNPNTGTTSPGNPDTYERSHKPKNSYGW